MVINTQYEDLLRRVMIEGNDKGDRTGTGTRSLFGERLVYNLAEGFPLITTKRVWFKGLATELLWFLNGDTNVRALQAQGVKIWDEWADEDGELGPVYGSQWRSWRTADGRSIDQIGKVIETLKRDPNSRRMVVSAWNVGELDKMALEPCHILFQFYVANNRLSCQVYQRSSDLFLGVPFNIASYALLTHLIAQEVGLDVGTLTWVSGDTHIYRNHFDQVSEQMSREIRPFPRLTVIPPPEGQYYRLNDFVIEGYDPHPPISAPVAV